MFECYRLVTWESIFIVRSWSFFCQILVLPLCHSIAMVADTDKTDIVTTMAGEIFLKALYSDIYGGTIAFQDWKLKIFESFTYGPF